MRRKRRAFGIEQSYLKGNYTYSERGITPLHVAAWYGHLNIAKYLIEKGANPNLSEFDLEETPLNFAIKRGHFYLARLLLKRGANPVHFRYFSDERFNDYFSDAMENGDSRVVSLLVKSGAVVKGGEISRELLWEVVSKEDLDKIKRYKRVIWM